MVVCKGLCTNVPIIIEQAENLKHKNPRCDASVDGLLMCDRDRRIGTIAAHGAISIVIDGANGCYSEQGLDRSTSTISRTTQHLPNVPILRRQDAC